MSSAWVRARAMACLVLPFVLGSCSEEMSRGGVASVEVPASSSALVMVWAQNVSEREQSLLQAELSRRASLVKPDDLANRDVIVRRSAARALARIRGEAARAGLLRALSDEDDEVVAWAAYGLGDDCSEVREQTVSALIAAASHWGLNLPGPAPAGLSAKRSIIRAIGRCASKRSEATLIGLAEAGGAHLNDVVFALGDVASHKKKLREETFVSLLKLAAGNAASEAQTAALYPLGRVAHLPPSVVERAREVAESRLGERSINRIFAVRALGRTDEQAVKLLLGVVVDGDRYTPAERAEAVRGLVRFGRAGQRALARALEKLIEPRVKLESAALLSPQFGILLELIGMLKAPGKARRNLRMLAKLPAPDQAPAPIVRRLSWLRCTAARILAGNDYDMGLLRRCDLTSAHSGAEKHPLEGSIGARAAVATIGFGGIEIRGKRFKTWRRYATGEQARARQDAIQLIAAHPEIRDTGPVLVKALKSKISGVVANAAEVIAKFPQRARKSSPRKKRKSRAGEAVYPGIESALLAGLEGTGATADQEALLAVIDAVGALALDSAKATLDKLCASPFDQVRAHSQKALGSLLGGQHKVPCDPPDSGMPLAGELRQLVSTPVSLKLETDVGDLRILLDPRLAPVAVTRTVQLAEAHYYDKMIVHRVVAGFVSQFGSPTADGYGGAPGKASIACETSPISFAPFTVGVALAGRDTGSSQLFVTHSSYPHLDGRYAQIGSASGAWDALFDGDVIQKVVVER